MGPDRSLNVLLVEDNPSERWLLSEILRSRGHVVTACEEAESAWDLFEATPFPLVVLDWLLPGIDGVEFLRRVRETPGGDRTVVLVVTGRDHAEALEEVLRHGANDYITKPVDVGLLNIRLAVAEKEVGAVERRRAAEDALAIKTRELETLFQNLDEVFFSLDVADQRLIQVSPAAFKLFGIPPDRLRDDPSLWSEFLFPDGWAAVEARLERTGRDESLVLQYPVSVGIDGERWMEASLKGEWDRDGKLVRVDGVTGDITERKRAQEELAARNQELRTLHRISEIILSSASEEEAYHQILEEVAQATGYGVVIIDHVRHDPARMVMVASRGVAIPEDPSPLEIPLEESLSGIAVRTGRPVLESAALSRPEHSHPALRKLGLQTWLSFPMTMDGEIEGVLTLAHPEPRDFDRRLVRWAASLANAVATFMDRMRSQEALRESEQLHRTLAQRLQEANRELESFGYTVSHDLRAPLRTMQGFAHTLLRDHGAALPEEGRDYARRIIASGKHSEDLIRDLLAYSRVSLQEMELSPVDLGSVVATAIEQMEADLKESGARVEVEGSLPRVMGDHTTLVQVVTNLLSNGTKFARNGTPPLIQVSGEERGDRFRLWVQDNGIGIPRDQQERIFRTFERTAGSESRPGTGIGLAIVRRGMERMGGRVGVESTVGEGSRFWAELPLP